MNACIVCAGDLAEHEPQTCIRCLGATRRDLAAIVECYALLPDELEHHATERIPGGDALVMLAPGSLGWTPIRAMLHCDDDPDRPIPESAYAHLADENPADPSPVAFELSRWDDDWRDIRDDDVRSSADLASIIASLNTRLGWAADHHAAFDEFAGDVHRLLTRVQVATAMADWPQTGARCTYCDVPLVRAYDEPKPCGHTGDEAEHSSRWDDELKAWVGGCRQGGLTENWTCTKCRRRYTPAEYRLALRKQGTYGWMPVHIAAEFAERTGKQIRKWVENGCIGARCGVRYVDLGDGPKAVRTGPLMVWWPDILERLARVAA